MRPSSAEVCALQREEALAPGMGRGRFVATASPCCGRAWRRRRKEWRRSLRSGGEDVEPQVVALEAQRQGVIETRFHEDLGVGGDGDRLLPLELEPLGLPLEGEIPADVPRRLDAEDGREIVRGEERPVDIRGGGGRHGKVGVMLSQVLRVQEAIRGLGGVNPTQPQLFDQPILERPKEPLDPALRLGTVRIDQLDLQVPHGAGVLGIRWVLAQLFLDGRRPIRPENAVLVDIQRDWSAFLDDIDPRGSHEGFCALRLDEDRVGDPTRGVIDEREQDARGASIFKPGMVGPIGLNQLPVARPPCSPGPMPRRAGVGCPESLGGHELSDRFCPQAQVVLDRELLGREGGSEIGIPRLEHLSRASLPLLRELVIRGPAPEVMGQPGRASGLEPATKAPNLAHTAMQQGDSLTGGQLPLYDLLNGAHAIDFCWGQTKNLAHGYTLLFAHEHRGVAFLFGRGVAFLLGCYI